MVSLFMNRPLWQKLMILFLLVGTVPLVMVSYQSTNITQNTLDKQTQYLLSGVRDTKAKSIQQYFENRKKELAFLATNPQVVSSAKTLETDFTQFLQQNEVDAAKTKRYQNAVKQYYKKTFGTEFEHRSGTNAPIEEILSQQSPTALALQYYYIVQNTNGLGEKHYLDAATDASSYSQNHAALHKVLRSALTTFGYYDIFIIDPDSGDVVYSVYKEIDFATNLKHGPWANSGLASAYQKALELSSPFDTALVDYARYRPSYDEPASFMAAPVYDKGKRVAIVAIQLPIESIDAILHDKSVLGETGDAFLVGPDYLMRSNSLRFSQTYNVKASFAHPEKANVKNRKAIQRAMEGKSGVLRDLDLGREKAVTAYSSIELDGFKWVIVIEQTQAEAFKSLVAIQKSNAIMAGLSIVAILIFAWLLGRKLASPIVNLRDLIKGVETSGELQQARTQQHNDEIGQTTVAFHNLLLSLKNAFGDIGNSLDNVVQGRFETVDADRYSGDIKRLSLGVNASVEQLKISREHQQKQQSDIERNAKDMENAAKKAEFEADQANKIKQALDVCNTAVIMADEHHNIVYMNRSSQALMRKYQGDMRSALPQFDAETLIGKNMDIFHRNPALQQALVNQLTGSRASEVNIAGKTLRITVSPIMKGNERVGAVTEWLDRTNEVSIEQSIGQLVKAAGEGDFSAQIDENDKEGFFLRLSQGLNALVNTTGLALEDMQRVMKGMAEGDLSLRIEKPYEGMFGELKTNINSTLSKIAGIVDEIVVASRSVSTGAAEIDVGVTDLSHRTEEQASSLEETTASMGEMTVSVKKSAQNADAALQLTQKAVGFAKNGREVVNKAVLSMQSINQSSKRIVDIIGVIDEIAFQTNLLALNAAVEAARAGEQGRGFSVVAAEVRRLAQRSAEAAKEIKILISDSVSKVDEGSALVNDSEKRLQDILQAIEQVTSSVEQIATASNQQAHGIAQVNIAITHMDESTQHNAALVEEASAAAKSMAAQASSMRSAVEFFRSN